MLSVLLKILAVIGIAILVLLGIVLTLILIVLFVPITYKIQGCFSEEKKEALGKINWLFGILRLDVAYSGELKYQLKLLHFDLTGLLTGKKNKSTSSSTQEPVSSDYIHITPSEEASCNSVTSVSSEATDKEEDAAEIPSEEKVSFLQKAENLVFKFKDIYAKIKNIWENISYYIALLQEDDTKNLLSHCCTVLIKVLKSIRPKKLKLDLLFGFDSPDTTGKIFGLLCMLYPCYGDDIHIVPDFDRKVLSGDIFCKGRIYICVLVFNALRILFDKKLYKVIRKLKNGGKQNGR